MRGEHEQNHEQRPSGRRALRAIFAADVAGFSAQLSMDETATFHSIMEFREIANAQLALHNGWLFGMPGDGIFALFESAVDSLKCGLEMQRQFANNPALNGMKMRIGIHLGEVLFEKDIPFGEALAIAARLEALADPGGVLVSSAVFDATSSRLPALFEPRGTPRLKNIPRRIETFAVKDFPISPAREETASVENLDRTTRLDRSVLRKVRDSVVGSSATSGDESRAAPQLADEGKSDLDESMDGLLDAKLEQDGLGDPLENSDPVKYHLSSRLQSDYSAFNTDEAEMESPSANYYVRATNQESFGGTAGELGSPSSYKIEFALEPHAMELFVSALAAHLGPLAKVIVERCASQVCSLDELVESLEKEVPAGDERMAFRIRAAQICLNSQSK